MVKFYTPKDSTAVAFVGVDGDFLHVIYRLGNATEYRIRLGAKGAQAALRQIVNGKSAGKTVYGVRKYAAKNALLWQSRRVSDGQWVTITH